MNPDYILYEETKRRGVVEYVKRLIYVENTYGAGFQRKLLEKLREDGLPSSNLDLGIERLPAGRYNKTLQRKVLAIVKIMVHSCSWGSLKDGINH